MYAVVKTGGKQYRVIGGQKLKVEQLLAEIGAEITLDQVLAVGEGESVKLGAPLVAGATVTAKVVAHGRGDKVHIFKMRRRKHYRKQQGHLQNYTELEIVGISGKVLRKNREPSWHIKKQVAVHVTVAIPSQSVWALKPLAAN